MVQWLRLHASTAEFNPWWGTKIPYPCMLSWFSRVRLFATLWTIASMGRLLCPWDSPGKNTGVGCHALLQGIFPNQESNPHLLSPTLADGSLPLAPPGGQRGGGNMSSWQTSWRRWGLIHDSRKSLGKLERGERLCQA